jgi:hypothetical protein
MGTKATGGRRRWGGAPWAGRRAGTAASARSATAAGIASLHPTKARHRVRAARRRGVEVCGADLAGALLTFGWAADHDDGDDALLGASHACQPCSALLRAMRVCEAIDGVVLIFTARGFGEERGPRVFLEEAIR